MDLRISTREDERKIGYIRNTNSDENEQPKEYSLCG